MGACEKHKPTLKRVDGEHERDTEGTATVPAVFIERARACTYVRGCVCAREIPSVIISQSRARFRMSLDRHRARAAAGRFSHGHPSP